MIDALADPGRPRRAIAADAFDVVVASLPGYGFSVPLERTGVTVRTTAALWVRLMRDVLGYDRFAAHGGDWGASITAQLGHEFPEHMIGVHLSLPVLLRVSYYSGLSADGLRAGRGGLVREDAEADGDGGEPCRRAVHGDPQTLAYALNDSPVGPGRVDPGAPAGVERPRRRRVRRLVARLPADQRDAVLGHREHRVDDALLLGELAPERPRRPRPGARHRGADGHRGVPQRPRVRSPPAGGDVHQPGAVDA